MRGRVAPFITAVPVVLGRLLGRALGTHYRSQPRSRSRSRWSARERIPQLAHPRLEIVWASGKAREHGVERRRIEGVDVRITTPPKTVADCFRYRRHVGLEVALAALRDYLRKHRGGVGALVEAARADRVYTFMRPYLEAYL